MVYLRGMVAIPLAAVVIAALAGCAQTRTPVATPTAAASSSSSESVAPPTYHPTGTAADNLTYFNKVGADLFNSKQGAAASTQGELIVNWFVAHGFDKANMEVTPDKTSIGLAAWNIDFSVKFGKSCILGQAGNVGFQSAVAPILATGKCLIGQTRTIDW